MKTEITSKISKLKATIKRPGKKQKEVWWKVTTPKPGGGRNRRFFQTETDADTYIEQQQIQLANYGTAGASMNEKLRGEALRASEILSPLGLSLLDAAKHYAAFISSTQGGMALSAAAEMFKDSREGVALGKKFSETYKKAIAHHLKHFVEAFPDKTTNTITADEINRFLNECKSVETAKTYRKHIYALFNFLVSKGKRDSNPLPKIKAVETSYDVQILTPEQCSRLLDSCDDATLPAVAIGMFCGLRASEIEKLDWSKVELNEKRIVIDKTVSLKTGRRIVTLHETCIAWIRSHAKTSGLVQPQDFRKLFDRVRVKAGFLPSYAGRKDDDLQKLLEAGKKRKVKLQQWPSNCLRHSAISYALTDCGDESKVATWAGNSPKIIKQHYDAQAKPSAAKAFYGIRPEMPENVEAFKKPKAA